MSVLLCRESTLIIVAQVDSPDSLENVETKWVGEIAENCPGVKLVLVALKCDLRKREDADEDEPQPEKQMINYDEGLRVAEKIKALRYLGIVIPPPIRALYSSTIQNAPP
jgi:Rho family protein